MIKSRSKSGADLFLIDDLHPEDEATLQALYSRSDKSVESHLEKVKASGSGKFMSQYYVGYGHKSIADCGTTTLFIENVSMLADKAIQDWPLYSGQETSTRFIDFSKGRKIIDPIGSIQSKSILDGWMKFYTENQSRVMDEIRKRHPKGELEKEDIYERAVKARSFDILRGFIPAGMTTQLSWHTNLRQAGDHLIGLYNHPLKEVQRIAIGLIKILHEQYPSSTGFGDLSALSGIGNELSEDKKKRQDWESNLAINYSYNSISNFRYHSEFDTKTSFLEEDFNQFNFERLNDCKELLNSRPRGCVLPHFMSDYGQIKFGFLMDFGSFRDLQRHRNGVCRMPLLSTSYGFHNWYLEQLDDELKSEATELIFSLQKEIQNLSCSEEERQYYIPMGYRVPCQVTYSLPALVYIMELRSGKMIHPTLRSVIHQIINRFKHNFPNVPIHVDMDPDDWSVRRGAQTITEK